MNREKARYFDSQVHADWAALHYTGEELQKIDRMLALAGWRLDSHILEPGCGTGRLTALLGERCGDLGSVLATDISEKMVEAARERTRDLPRVSVELRSLEEVALGDREFDLVICHQVFPHFDDKVAALRIMGDCLNPTGRFVVFHFINSSQINDMHRKVDPSVMSDSMPDYEDMRKMLSALDFKIDMFEDDEHGYLLIASSAKDVTS